jgi:hypothetical protein
MKVELDRAKLVGRMSIAQLGAQRFLAPGNKGHSSLGATCLARVADQLSIVDPLGLATCGVYA